MQIILASKSPRRKQLLRAITKDFVIVPSHFNEKKIRQKNPVKFACQAAIAKAKSVGKIYPEAVIIGADTIVFINGKILGKPKDYQEALDTLSLLSDSKHEVITAVALYWQKNKKLICDYEVTKVIFKPLSQQQIQRYLKRGDFYDKAGSYAIQHKHDKFVKKIEGSYENVVGFPVKKVKKLLKKFNVI